MNYNNDKYLKKEEINFARDVIGTIISDKLIEEFEFQTRIGYSKSEISKIILNWPPENNNIIEWKMVCACLNEICNGLELSDSYWANNVKFSRKDLQELHHKLQMIVESQATYLRVLPWPTDDFG